MTPKDLTRSPRAQARPACETILEDGPGFRGLMISGAEDVGTRPTLSQVPRPIPGAHLLCPAHRVESCQWWGAGL